MGRLDYCTFDLAPDDPLVRVCLLREALLLISDDATGASIASLYRTYATAPSRELEPLSEIIRELNERFGTEFREEDRVFIRQLEERLALSPALTASVRANTPENARLTFDHVVGDELQEMMDTNFTFYKRVTDDRQFAKVFLDWLFERFRKEVSKV